MLKNGETNLGVAQQFLSAARRDPKKSSLMAALALLLVVLLARMFFAAGSDLGPARAGAAVARASATSGNPPIVSDADSLLSADRFSSAMRANAVEQRLREWLSEPVRPISRNLFALKLDYYPVDGSRVGPGQKNTADGEFWAKLEKSLMLQADQRDKRDNLVANYTAAAGKMRLDSIMMGPQPKAMIDGKLVTEGDVAAGFRVLKIEPRRIMIEREGIRLEIQMK